MTYTRDTYPYKYGPGYAGSERADVWPAADVMALMCQTGFFEPDDGRALIALQVWIAESSLQALVRGKTLWAPGNQIHLSHAMGMFQLLSAYHMVGGVPAFPGWELLPEADIMNPHKSWPRAWALMHKSGAGFTYTEGQYNLNFNWWSGYTNGMYMDRGRRDVAYLANEQYLAGLA